MAPGEETRGGNQGVNFEERMFIKAEHQVGGSREIEVGSFGGGCVSLKIPAFPAVSMVNLMEKSWGLCPAGVMSSQERRKSETYLP